jgi:DnaJ-class molecular chaperone
MSHSEGCRMLTSVVPLRAGESHCPHCSGYGANPVPRDHSYTQLNPLRCFECNGTGKASN